MTPGRKILYLLVCVLLGVMLGGLSWAVGIKPSSLALGILALIMITCCTFIPLSDDYQRIKDSNGQ